MSTRSQIEFYDDIPEGEFGEPAARIYQHSDGYPDPKLDFTPLGRLKTLYKLLKKGFPMYGSRTTDPEWAAAEYISQFREKGQAGLYVSQQIHGDIAYLYRVVCKSSGWEIHVFESEYNAAYDISGFKELDCRTLR